MDVLLTSFQAAELLGISRSTLLKWENDGKLLPTSKINKDRRYSLNELMKFKLSNFALSSK